MKIHRHLPKPLLISLLCCGFIIVQQNSRSSFLKTLYFVVVEECTAAQPFPFLSFPHCSLKVLCKFLQKSQREFMCTTLDLCLIFNMGTERNGVCTRTACNILALFTRNLVGMVMLPQINSTSELYISQGCYVQKCRNDVRWYIVLVFLELVVNANIEMLFLGAALCMQLMSLKLTNI